MKKSLVAAALLLTMTFCSMPVQAAPQTMSDGTIFDADYYARTNLDVVAAVGISVEALYNHYMLFGKNEGRLPYDNGTGTANDVFDPVYYAQHNPDVVAVYGYDAQLLYRHYLNCGKAEGRKPNAFSSTQAAVAQLVKAEVAALGITYDPSRDEKLADNYNRYWPVGCNWNIGCDHSKPIYYHYHYTRADYTNDPLYLALVRELLKAHGDHKKDMLVFYDTVGGVSFRNADRDYLRNLVSNLMLDYIESVIGADVTDCHCWGYTYDTTIPEYQGLTAHNRVIMLSPNSAGAGFENR